MKNDNPRVIRTKGYLKEALIELLTTTSFENITIKAICQKAAVNRSTFYAYYTCPRDLIEEIEQDIISQLPDYKPTDQKPFFLSMKQLMEYIRKNRNTFYILLTSSADRSFGEQIIAAVMDKYDELANFSNIDDKEMSFIFVINGVVGIIREWIEKGFQMSVDRITYLIIDMAFRSVGLDPQIAYKTN